MQFSKLSQHTPRLSLVCGLSLGAIALSTGCISTDRTVYRDEPRMKVEFQNDTAARLFYETLSKMPNNHGRTESNTEVSIPVIFDHKRRVVEGENFAFNRAVRQCDTNGDGRITEKEARIFADQMSKRH